METPRVHISVVTRSFQAGTDQQTFDHALFLEKVAKPIDELLRTTGTLITSLIVVTNGDTQSPLAEKVDEHGTTPTTHVINEYFQHDGRISTHICTDWGNNPGSGNALNEGDHALMQQGSTPEYILHWSPEMEMKPRHLYRAIDILLDRPAVHTVGFYRKHWWEKTQWNIVQNTAALYRASTLMSIGGFSQMCDGIDKKMVTTQKYGDVLLAGMEDFHAMLRMLREDPEMRHGIVGIEDPLTWDTHFADPARELAHQKKVARQYRVMDAWCKDVFPERTPDETLNHYFSTRISD